MVLAVKITDNHTSHILFQKLPKRSMQSLCILGFKHCKLEKLQRKMSNYIDWSTVMLPISITKQKVEYVMDADYIQSLVGNIYKLLTQVVASNSRTTSMASTILWDELGIYS